LAADLRSTPVAFDLTHGGTLNAETPASLRRLRLAQSAQVHFVLSVDGPAGSFAELVVRDLAGNIVARMPVTASRGRSVDLYLAAGDYRVGVRSLDPTVGLSFDLGISIITDPIGPEVHDSTDDPSGASPNPPSSAPPPSNSPPPPSSNPPPSNPPASPPPDENDPYYWWSDDPYADGPMWY